MDNNETNLRVDAQSSSVEGGYLLMSIRRGLGIRSGSWAPLGWGAPGMSEQGA